MERIRVEITKDNPIGLKKGDLRNLKKGHANRLIKRGMAKLYKEKIN